MSSPALYYPIKAETVDGKKARRARADVIIYGGGGQLHRDSFYSGFAYYRVAWGIGDNRSGEISYPPCLDDFWLVGLRDWESPYQWVPCASCKHSGFDKQQPPSREAVAYLHHERELELDLPTLRNSCASMEEALSFLASGATVYTNCYHGAYWSLLLGRRVELVDCEWSNKFRGIKWDLTLEECRQANDNFWEQVRPLLTA